MPSMYLFVSFYILSFLMVLGSDDWFMLWMGLELNMISFIVIMYVRYDQLSVECCIKYFFVQSIGSAVFMSCFYLSSVFLSNMILLMLSYKMGAAPIFFWFPSICSNLTWNICYVLMTIQKLLPLFLMMMFVGSFLWFIILMSLLVGLFGSFNQKNLKVLLAYSSIHHLGWIYLCMMCSEVTSLIYLFMYMFVIMGVVFLLKFEEIVFFTKINSWKGKWLFIFNILGMAGIPPLLGFFLKWFSFLCINSMHIVCIVFMLLVSVIMFYVYFRMVYDLFMCFGEKLSFFNSIEDNKLIYYSDYYLMMGGVVAFGVYMYMYM